MAVLILSVNTTLGKMQVESSVDLKTICTLFELRYRCTLCFYKNVKNKRLGRFSSKSKSNCLIILGAI